MTEFKQDERLSRQQAAERLIDIAYALIAGGPLDLIEAGRRSGSGRRSCAWSVPQSRDRVELGSGELAGPGV